MQAPGGFAIAPLPPGWTEHRAPTGHAYYYNAFTKESSYIRPMSSFPLAGFPATSADAKGKGGKKFKSKTPIGDTPWIRVVTNSGDVFYTHTGKKESVWTVPEEIQDAVAQLLEEEQKASQATVPEPPAPSPRSEVKPKRKVMDASDEVKSKKARVEEEVDENEDDSSDEEEEEWQREAAAQLAAEAAEAEKKRREEEEELKRMEKQRGDLSINMPNRVDISIDEGKALFKTLLSEKNINPLLPWDTALPQFVSDPRYVLLPSVSARRDAFDDYCRDRARELREAKITKNAASTEHKDSKAEYEKLLREEVKSTRTNWSDWRRTWKKDRRFYGWGRDDREREKKFKEWLKELGEQKRKAAAKAEADFFALLKEQAAIGSNATWKEVKRGLDKDPRYDAVGSSSLREELFNTYITSVARGAPAATARTSAHATGADEDKVKDNSGLKEDDREKKARAVREREAKVRRERERLDAEHARSRKELTRDEDELQFLSLLTDAIREPTATWAQSLAELSIDPRFTHSTLPRGQQQALFARHVSNLRSKHLTALQALFAAHASALNARFSDLPTTSICESLPSQKLRLDIDSGALEEEFNAWSRERVIQAERDFQDMLNENAFVEFWGRLKKMKEDNEGGMKVEVGADDLAGEECDDDRELIDLKSLAKAVDVQEIERVLKNDKRYTLFDHDPEQREGWIRAHIEKLAAPKLSVHVPDVAR